MSPTTPTCPRCGEPLVPVLDTDLRRTPSGRLLADPQVRMACATCPPVRVPDLPGGGRAQAG